MPWMSRHRRIRGSPPPACSFKQRIVPTRPEIPKAVRWHMGESIYTPWYPNLWMVYRCLQWNILLKWIITRGTPMTQETSISFYDHFILLLRVGYAMALPLRSPRRTTNLQEHKTWLRTLQAGWIGTLPEKGSPYIYNINIIEDMTWYDMYVYIYI